MSITQVAAYTPTDRRPQAFALSSPAALEVNNQTTMRLVVFVSRTLRDVLLPGDHKIYSGLNNLAVAPTWVLVQPDDVPDSGGPLNGFVTLTTYGVSDALPAQGSYTPGNFTMPTLTVQDRSSLIRSLAAVQVRDFNPDPTGFVDAQPQIQAALDVARVMGGCLVYCEEGAYLLNSAPAHPVNGAINVSLVVGSKTVLRGAGPGKTVFKFGTAIPNQAFMIGNYSWLSNTDTDLALEDIELDGNAANMPGTIDAHYGARWTSAQRTLYRNVVAHDFVGTTAGGNGPNGTPGENYMLDVHTSSVCRFEHCVCYDTSNKTASGFSCNSSTNITISDCFAYHMKFSRGFTHWHCGSIQYSNCHGYLQQAAAGSGGDGFNSEQSKDVFYVNCLAGGSSADQDGNPYLANTSLANTGHGFNCSNAQGRHVWTGCISSGNGGSGLIITSGASASALEVVGGIYRSNAAYGIDADSAGGPLLRVSPATLIANNTTNQIRYDGTNASATVGALTAPAIPGTGVNFANPFPFACLVEILTGTLTSIKVAGVQVGTTAPAMLVVPPGQNINLTYSVAPTWSWVSLL